MLTPPTALCVCRAEPASPFAVYCFLKYSSDAFAARVVNLPNGTIAPDINADIRYGDIRVNGRWNINMSVKKDVPVTECVQLQVSAEAGPAWYRMTTLAPGA